MRFSEIYKRSRVLSLEFFPPKAESGVPETLALIERLAKLSPDFMTVTYGAGGGQRGAARELVTFIRDTLKLVAVQHLTCSRHSTAEIDAIADELIEDGIEHVLALRGDPVQGTSTFVAHPEGFSCARDLTKHLNARGQFSLAVAGYPETHREATSREADLAYLKEKVDAGAEVVITQLFFDNDFYFRFLDDLSPYNVAVPIVPGLMPIANVAQVKRFTSLCGASIPPQVAAQLSRLEGDPEGVVQYGIDLALEQGRALLERGAPGLHLYTLNKSSQVEAIIRGLGLGGAR
ncbi:MAG: methylenetetrahydrofolate reductase [Deltaproteobacteria bacterium]|nr:methylenetetrahydrofolate reductase [Deltaproteobacteria bacterium]